MIARFVARVDRLNAVLVLPFVAWVPGGWAASSTLASMLALTLLASMLTSSLGFDSTLLAFDDADCSLASILGRLDRWLLVAQDDRLASWSRNAVTLARVDTSPIGHLSDRSLQGSFRSLFHLLRGCCLLASMSPDACEHRSFCKSSSSNTCSRLNVLPDGFQF